MQRTVFLGQAPARPGSKHALPGSYLYPWLFKIGLSLEDINEYCRFYALAPVFPGSNKHGHATPTPDQITTHLPAVVTAIGQFNPSVVVPVGKLAIQAVLSTTDPLEQLIGREFNPSKLNALKQSTTIIPLPHPSGRSTWVHRHPELLTAALTLIKQRVGS